MKKLISVLCATVLTSSVTAGALAANIEQGEPDVIVNNSRILFRDQPAKILDGRTLVPARDVFSAMGHKVSWDGENRVVTVVSDTGVRDVTITIDSDKMKVRTFKTIMEADVKEVTLDVPAQIINDRTMIPLRAVSEAFDCSVDWNEDTYVVNITTGAPILLEGATPPTPTPVEDLVSMSLETDTETVKAGDEFDVYITAGNMPENSYVSGVTATFNYDKEKAEFVSATLLNDSDEPLKASIDVANDEYDTGCKCVYIMIDETVARTKPGRVFKATFKALSDGASPISLGNAFSSLTSYETSLMLTTGKDENLEDTMYEGSDLNLDTAPITFGK